MARRRRRHALVGAVVAVQLGFGLVVPSTAVTQAAPAALSPAAQAKATGHRVEVPDLTTPTEQVFANPEGTLTMEAHAVPVRGRKDGKWVPVDTTLRFEGNGSVVQTAGAADTAFSGGGSGALVRLAEGDKNVEMSWPRPLPRPELSKDTALYREVLPGVDLKMRALPQGFSKVLVVKNRKAAENPELAKLSFGIRTSGVSVQRQDDGTVAAVDSGGREVFRAGTPRMWDTGAARKQSVMPVEVAADRIAIVPDQGLLTAPDTTYPVEIDPDWGVGRSAWAIVFGIPDGYATQSYWFGDGDNIAKVGYSNHQPKVVLARTYFQFDTAAVLGKHIIKAQFDALQTWVPDCRVRKVVTINESLPIHPGTTWNTQPGPGAAFDAHDDAAGGSSCPQKRVGFDVTQGVANSVKANRPTTTLVLKADEERNGDAWKKFDPNSVSLIVTYNSVPNAPRSMTTDGKPCSVVPNQQYVSKAAPELHTVPTDPDGGAVVVKFEWFIRLAPNHKGEATTLQQPSGSRFGVALPTTHFKNGDTIAWHAQTFDGIDWSPWSDWCDATVDQDRPAAPPTVSSPDFPRDGVGGGLGTTGKFVFEPNGVTDVVAYQYDLHDQPQRRVDAGPDGKATALVTPPDDTYYDLYVRSVDRAGNLSDLSVPYHFRPGIGSPPTGIWRLNGHAGETDVPDTSGRGNHGKVNGSTRWTFGRQDDALQLDGDGFVSASGPAVRTDATFTVSAWVRLGLAEDAWRTTVSQDGPNVSGFFLQLNAVTHKWNFTMVSTPDADAPRRVAESNDAARQGRWTHLTGMYDRATGKVSLHVDGILQAGTATHTTPWQANGPLQIGRAWYRGEVDKFRGTIDEVRVYDRLLSEREVHSLASSPTTTEGSWQFEERSGVDAVDVSGNNRVASLRGGAAWSPIAAVGDGAVHFDGVSGHLVTGSQAIATDTSFTVSAYVRVTGETGNWQTAVSQDGPKSSGFSLRYKNDTKRWSFAVSTQDADNPVMVAAESTELAAPGEWTQLTGVYDESDRQLRLYVNSALSRAVPIEQGTHFKHVPGSIVIGRAKLAAQETRFWAGEIDHVQLYTGVRTDDQISEDARTPPLPQSTIYKGQFSRWVSHGGQHTVSMDYVPRGSHFEGSLGFPAPAGTPNTRMLYSCRSNVNDDEFTAIDPACDGHRVLGELGLAYLTPPADVPTIPIHRCVVTGIGEHFVSKEPNCENQTVLGRLGYTRAYTYLIRYRAADGGGEHQSATKEMPGSHRPEGVLGVVAMTTEPGTVPLVSCRNDTDTFLSVQSDCEGKLVTGPVGSLWSAAPPNAPSHALLRCRATGSEELFESMDPGCEGQALDRALGFVLDQG